jgi:hypothetical protein
MRRRFSIRILFIGIAIVATVVYVFVVRPSAIAQRFVAAIALQDYDRAGAMLRLPNDWVRIVRPLDSEKADRVYAELQPREWRDVWNCRRRIRVTVSRHSNNNGGYVDWTEDSEFVALPMGLDGTFPAALDINWPTNLPSQPAIINPGEGLRLEADLRTG